MITSIKQESEVPPKLYEVSALAFELGVSENTASDWIDELGIKPVGQQQYYKYAHDVHANPAPMPNRCPAQYDEEVLEQLREHKKQIDQ